MEQGVAPQRSCDLGSDSSGSDQSSFWEMVEDREEEEEVEKEEDKVEEERKKQQQKF